MYWNTSIYEYLVRIEIFISLVLVLYQLHAVIIVLWFLCGMETFLPILKTGSGRNFNCFGINP